MGLLEKINKSGIHYSYQELADKFNCNRKSIINFVRSRNLGIEIKTNYKIYTAEEIERIKEWKLQNEKRIEDRKKNKPQKPTLEERLPEEMKNYKYVSYSELSEKTGKNKKTISNWCERNNIGVHLNGHRCFSEEDLQKILSGTRIYTKKHQEKPKKKILWKLSIFDSSICRFIVKHCALTEEEARKQEFELIYRGYMVRISPQYIRKVRK